MTRDTHTADLTGEPSGPSAHTANHIRSRVTWMYLAALAVSAILSTLSTLFLIGVTDLQQSKRVEVYVLAATLITLGLEGMLIFVPMAQRLHRQHDTLLTQVTEQKRVQDELKASENRYRLLVRNLPDSAIIMFDQTMRYTLAEGPFLERAGYQKEKVVGRLPADIMSSASVEALTPLYRAALAGETTVVERAVGDLVHFTRILPVRNEVDEVIGGMILAQDVTQQRKIEAKLRESEEQYRSLFENSLDAVMLTDTDGKIHRANSAACQMLGYSEAEIAQLGRSGVVDTGDPRLAAALEERARTGHFRGELTMIRHDGSKVPVEVSTQTFAAVGDVYKTSMVIRDISRRKQAEQRNIELALEQEKVQLLSNFVTSTSHDLRTPLSIITTSTYLCRKATTVEQQTVRLDAIDEEVQRLNNIIEQLHRMASLDKKLDLHRESTSVNALADELARKIRPLCADRQLELHTDFAPSLPNIQADPTYLTDAFMMIAENALLYTPAGGTLLLATALTGSHIEVKIADTGIGIGAEHLPHIFERFYKVDQARTDHTTGAGLGLTMAKRIVNEHEGQIAVESQPGQGTTVVVTLPVAQ